MSVNIQPVTKPLGIVLRPLTINMDNTMNVTASLVVVDKVSVPNAEGSLVEEIQCNPTGQQSYHQLSAEEGLKVLNSDPQDGETQAQALDRTITEILRDKGSLNF